MKIPHVHFPIVSCGFSRSCSTEAPFCKSAAKAAPEARICRTPCSLDLGHNGKIMGKSMNDNSASMHQAEWKNHLPERFVPYGFMEKKNGGPGFSMKHGKMMGKWWILWFYGKAQVWKPENGWTWIVYLYIYIFCYFMLFEWGDKQMDLGVHHFQTNPNGKIS